MTVYVVSFNGHISQEGYANIDDAIKYCSDRATRDEVFGWQFVDNRGNTYKIHAIKII